MSETEDLRELEIIQEGGRSDSSLVDIETLDLCDVPDYYNIQDPDASYYINGTRVPIDRVYQEAESFIQTVLNDNLSSDFTQSIDAIISSWQGRDFFPEDFHDMEYYDEEFWTDKDKKDIIDDGSEDDGSDEGGSEDDSSEDDSLDEQSLALHGGCKSAIIEFAAQTPQLPALEYEILVKPGQSIDDRTVIARVKQGGEWKNVRSIFSQGTVREDLEDDDFGRLYKTVCSRHIIIDCYQLAQGKSTDGMDMSWLNENPEFMSDWMKMSSSAETALYIITEIFPYLMYLRLIIDFSDAVGKLIPEIDWDLWRLMYILTRKTAEEYFNEETQDYHTPAGSERTIFVSSGHDRNSLEGEFTWYIKKYEKRREEFIEKTKEIFGTEDNKFDPIRSTLGNVKSLRGICDDFLKARAEYVEDILDMIENPKFRFPLKEPYREELYSYTSLMSGDAWHDVFDFKIPEVLLPKSPKEIRKEMETILDDKDELGNSQTSELGDSLANDIKRKLVNPIGGKDDGDETNDDNLTFRTYFERLSKSLRSGGIHPLEEELADLLQEFAENHPISGDARKYVRAEIVALRKFLTKCLKISSMGFIKSTRIGLPGEVGEPDEVLKELFKNFYDPDEKDKLIDEAKWPVPTDYEYRYQTYAKYTFPNLDALSSSDNENGEKPDHENENNIEDVNMLDEVKDLTIPDTDSVNVDPGDVSALYEERGAEIEEELQISETTIDDIDYWRRYCGIATLVTLPFLATGLVIEGVPVMLPCIYIPLKVFSISKVGLIVVMGLAIRGVSVNLMMIVINMSNQANSLMFPATMLLADIRDQFFSQASSILDLINPITQGINMSLKSNIVAMIKDNKKSDAEMVGLKALVLPGKNEIVRDIKEELGMDTRMIVNRLERDGKAALDEVTYAIESVETPETEGEDEKGQETEYIEEISAVAEKIGEGMTQSILNIGSSAPANATVSDEEEEKIHLVLEDIEDETVFNESIFGEKPEGTTGGGDETKTDNGGRIGDGVSTDTLSDGRDESLGNCFYGVFNNSSGGADADGYSSVTIGYIVNIPTAYGKPKIKEIVINTESQYDGTSMFKYADIKCLEYNSSADTDDSDWPSYIIQSGPSAGKRNYNGVYNNGTLVENVELASAGTPSDCFWISLGGNAKGNSRTDTIVDMYLQNTVDRERHPVISVRNNKTTVTLSNVSISSGYRAILNGSYITEDTKYTFPANNTQDISFTCPTLSAGNGGRYINFTLSNGTSTVNCHLRLIHTDDLSSSTTNTGNSSNTLPPPYTGVSLDSDKKHYYVSAKILKNGASLERRVRAYFDFENSSNYNYINVFQKKGDGTGNSDVIDTGGSAGGWNNFTNVKYERDEEFEECLGAFSTYAKVTEDDVTFRYLWILFKEARSQYYNGDSENDLPYLYDQDLFPSLYNFGGDGTQEAAFKTLVGWLFALVLAELKPKKRSELFEIGYGLGGYNKDSNIYGYAFDRDPNIARIVAGALYVSMRGKKHPNTSTMRKEVNGSMYDRGFLTIVDVEKRANYANENDFYINHLKYMPSAPGPYQSGYNWNGTRTSFPNQYNLYTDYGNGHDDYKNLSVDRHVHEMIVSNYNLSDPSHKQEVVQAIADKDWGNGHLFGPNRTTKNYHFHPMFGEDNIGIELPTNGNLCNLVQNALTASSSSRYPLQDPAANPAQYGRIRPGSSWNGNTSENGNILRNSSDDRRNFLVDFEIEDGDGSPTGHYDKDGNWVYLSSAPAGTSSPAAFNDKWKDVASANSYPSGHSSGSMGGAMVLMELMPNRADLILKAANQFAVNRTIARYHWTSDTIIGRVLGTAQHAVAHATKDYDDLLAKAKKDLPEGAVPTEVVDQSDPTELDEFLSVYNKGFFANSSLTYPVNEPIKSGSSVYSFLSDATDYFNHQYSIIDFTHIFEDQMEVNGGYEITSVDKEACFGWFLAYVLYSLYPFTVVGDAKTRNSTIFDLAFKNWCGIWKGHDYSKTDPDQYISKYGGSILASIIFARMISDKDMRDKFKHLKTTTYSTHCMQEYWYNDGEKFLYQDMYAPKGEDFFPLPVKNGDKNAWLYERDIKYHNIGGQMRGTDTHPEYDVWQQALSDRETGLSYYIKMFTEIDYDNNEFKTVSKPSSVTNKVPITPPSYSWTEAIDENNPIGFNQSYLGYDRTGHQKYCLLDLSRKSGNRVAQRIKAKESYFRARPIKYLSEEKTSSSFPYGGYVGGTYYYDNVGKEEVTSTLIEGSSYPSGHTGCGWFLSMAYCTAFRGFSEDENTRDLEKMFMRGFQYCESRTILGAHWHHCVDMGRIAAACGFAATCANKAFIEQIDNAQRET